MKVGTFRYWGDKKVALTIEAEGVTYEEMSEGLEEWIVIGARDLIDMFRNGAGTYVVEL